MVEYTGWQDNLRYAEEKSRITEHIQRIAKDNGFIYAYPWASTGYFNVPSNQYSTIYKRSTAFVYSNTMSFTEHPYTPPTGAPIHQLVVKPIFDALEPREKLYAQYLAKAAWHGSKIIMHQVSPESPVIFDFIMDLYHGCAGKWGTLVTKCGITYEELESFLEYAATFLCNLGNYYVSSSSHLLVVSELICNRAKVIRIPPFSLGYPGKDTQSAYYPSVEHMSREEIAKVSKVMIKFSIGPENTRVQKLVRVGKTVYRVLQASTNMDTSVDNQQVLEDDMFLVGGDHSDELSRVCADLTRANEYAGNEKQIQILDQYIEHFRSGSLEPYEESQKVWVKDVSAKVEHLIRFIEPYCDPGGIRAEWEAMMGIADPNKTARLKRFVDSSTSIIRQLPWAVEGVNDGKGPFEKSLFEAPDFTVLHG
ncbi:unnamed protein product [Aspergillus oryzae]|nr:unnamed protein product [Aspergillus oryzae]GMF83951.1 unnamed protein product [Aspergillus oryzae]